MAEQGSVLTSPEGGKLIFRQTASDTNGELLEMEVTYAPHSNVPPLHYHPQQDETFTVLEGALFTQIGGVEREYQAGEVFVTTPGTEHLMYNVGEEEAVVTWQTRPALKSEDFFETSWALANAGKNNTLQMAVVVHAHKEEFRLNKTPGLLIAVLAFCGRLLGYKAYHAYEQG
jgi:quercetin dioxygenase-like cupin family protein